MAATTTTRPLSDTPEQDIGVPLTVLDRTVSISAVRIGIIVASSLLGSIGWVFVLGHQGQLASELTLTTFGWAAAISMVIGVVLAIGPFFEQRPRLRRVLVVALVGAAIARAVQTWIDAALVVLAICVLAVWVRGVTSIAQRVRDRFGAPLSAGVLRTASALLLLVVVLSIGLGSAASAFAAEPVAATCGNSDVSAIFDGTQLDLNRATVDLRGSPIDLDDGAASYPLIVTSETATPILVTVELIETAPINVVDGGAELLWHDRVAGPRAFARDLTLTSDGLFDTFKVAIDDVDDVDIEIPAFAGTAVVRLTVTDEATGERCRTDVLVKIMGAPWRTLLGAAAACGLIIGGAGVASAALSSMRPVLPEPDISGCKISPQGSVTAATDIPTFVMEADTQAQIRFQLNFAGVKEDDEQLELLKRQGKDAVTIRDIPSLIKADITMVSELRGVIGVVADVTAIKAGSGVLTFEVAGHPIETLVEVVIPTAPEAEGVE